jgi:hypothetical protein
MNGEGWSSIDEPSKSGNGKCGNYGKRGTPK